MVSKYVFFLQILHIYIGLFSILMDSKYYIRLLNSTFIRNKKRMKRGSIEEHK